MVLAFDMDGVLVDVSESYREAIAATVASFSGQRISREFIQDYKNRGGWNNDWALSQRILLDLGYPVPYQTVIDRFQQLFIGSGNDGLILRERWVAQPGLLEGLAERHQLAVFTGRLRSEAEFTLQRFAPCVRFDPIITTDDVANGKPAPDGLLLIAEAAPGQDVIYIGDTVDDARSARAAAARFIGIAAPSNPRYSELRGLLAAEGAFAVLDDINSLEAALARL